MTSLRVMATEQQAENYATYVEGYIDSVEAAIEREHREDEAIVDRSGLWVLPCGLVERLPGQP